jgi:TRAP-type mannitol/chloroaromatic compound transport system substrate-binding protein
MNAQQLTAWLVNGGGYELWKELYADFGLIPIPGGNTGVQMGGWFNKKIEQPEDLNGLKMRIPGLGGQVLERAGGAAVLVAGGEIYTSLERGVIDATEWIGPYHDYRMGFHRIARYYYYPGWHEPGAQLEFFINKKEFEQLPEDLQQICLSAAYHIQSRVLPQFDAENARYLQKIKDEGEVKILPFPDEVLEELQQHTTDVLLEVANADPFSKKVYESYKNFQDKAAPWTKITEKAYIEKILGI